MATTLDADYLTVEEAAALVRVNQSTIRRWIRTGALPAYRVGQRYVRIKRDDLDGLIVPVAPKVITIDVGEDADSDGSRREVIGSIDKIASLTEAKRERALQTLAELNAFQQELLAKRGGVPFPPSWELIRETRDER